MSDTNKVEIEGKIIKIFEDREVLNITMSVVHEHSINGHKDLCESFFRILVNDYKQVLNLRHLQKGDRISVKAHLKLDYAFTSGGNRKEKVRIYGDDVRLVGL